MKKRNITVYRSRRDIKDIENPLIMLQGRWLYNAGFSVGDRITITCQDGKLAVVKTGSIWSDEEQVMAAEEKTEYMGEAVC